MTKGRSAPRPTMITATGYEIAYRHLSPDTLTRLNAAVQRELASTKPEPPTQRMQTGPDEWRDIPNPSDPTYAKALTAWQKTAENEAGKRILTLCEEYALIYEVDDEEVAALRAAHAVMGDPLDAESDTHVFLWRIVFPGLDTVQTMMGRLFGQQIEEAIAAQKDSFRRNVGGAAPAGGAARPADEPGAVPHGATG